MSKVDQLEYLHCNSVVMWPEYHKIKPIKINWMSEWEIHFQCISLCLCSASVKCMDAGNMTNHSNTHNPTKFLFWLCYVQMWCCDVCDVTLDSAWCVKGVAVGRGWVSAHRKAELSYQQCECDITVMRDIEFFKEKNWVTHQYNHRPEKCETWCFTTNS